MKLICFDKNYGYSKAKNEAIIHSSSKYIVHLDADDCLTPDSLQIRLDKFEQEKEAKVVHGKVYSFFDDKSYRWCLDNMSSLSFIEASPHAQGVMIKRECYEKHGLYDESLRSKGDREMWVRLRDLVGIKFYQITDYIFFGKLIRQTA